MFTETLEAPPEVATEKPAIVATLILHDGGGGQLIKVIGRTQRHDFKKRDGVSHLGKHGHVLEFTDIAEFHRVEDDIRSARMPQKITTRLGTADPVETAKSAIRQIVDGPIGGPVQKQERLGEIANCVVAALALFDAEVEKEAPPESIDPAPVPVNEKRANRERELRRMGEELVRNVMVDNYQIEGIRPLNNFDGMIVAVLQHEEGLGMFDEKPVETSKIDPAIIAPLAPEPSAPARTENNPMKMKLDALKEKARSMGVPVTEDRMEMVRGIGEKRKANA